MKEKPVRDASMAAKRLSRVTVGLMALIYLGLNGCATVKPDGERDLNRVPETVDIRFRRPLVVKTPEGDPVTVEERIRCGLFYFEKDRFAEAAGQFDMARKGIADHDNPLYRACLMSMAACYLLTDDRAAFVKTVRELRSTYTEYQLIAMEKRDPGMRTLLRLSDEFVKSGNY